MLEKIKSFVNSAIAGVKNFAAKAWTAVKDNLQFIIGF